MADGGLATVVEEAASEDAAPPDVVFAIPDAMSCAARGTEAREFAVSIGYPARSIRAPGGTSVDPVDGVPTAVADRSVMGAPEPPMLSTAPTPPTPRIPATPPIAAIPGSPASPADPLVVAPAGGRDVPGIGHGGDPGKGLPVGGNALPAVASVRGIDACAAVAR